MNRAALFLAAMFLAVCPLALAADAHVTTPEIADFRIGIDDVLDVGVWNVPELQKTVPVRPDGKISLPLVHDVIAAGLTPMQLREELTAKMATFIQNPDVSVVVREIHSAKISVIGQVKTPGRYDIKGPATVLDALALAGGFTEFAGRRKISILRASKRIPFDYDAAVSEGNANVFVKPGDIVVVP